MRTRQLLCFLTAALALLLFSFASYGEGRPFITRWKGEAGKELKIPINGRNYKLVIKRASDGSVLVTKNNCDDTYSYTPTETGEFLVEAGPEGVSSFGNNYNASKEALLRVEQFGTVQWQTMEEAFNGCENMQFSAGIDTPYLSQVTDMGYMFSGCTSFNQPLNSWDVSQVTNMVGMFRGCTAFNQPLNDWNVSKVKNMGQNHGDNYRYGMFFGCTSFNQPLNNWDVSKVTSMSCMFSGCTSFNQPLNNWDVSKVTNMWDMFTGCTSFNQPLNSWDVSQVTDMGYMFSGCTSFNQPLNSWDVSKVTSMSCMFSGCTAFNQDLGMWKLEKCEGLGLDDCGMSVENYSKSLVGWAAQTNINQNLPLRAGGLKYNASAKAARKQLIKEKQWSIGGDSDENGRPFITRWKGEAGKVLWIPIKGHNYRLVIKKASDGRILESVFLYTSYNEMTGTYVYTYTPTEDGELLLEASPEGVEYIHMSEGSAECLLRVEQFGSVQWETVARAFEGCKNLQFAEGIDTPDLSQVTYMFGMFAGCTSFNQPLNSWDVSQVTDMSSMFSGCTAFNQPLNNWDVSQVTDMWGMFSGCTSFNQDLGMWKLERCQKLGLDNCGMSVENYSKSLIGWATQDDIHSFLQLEAKGLKYFVEATTARNTLVRSKHWTIRGDMLLALTFGTKKISLIKGVEHMLKLTKEGIDESETIAIASSDPTIVQIVDVASSIKIKGIRGGTATITATVAANGSHGELIDKCEVTVTASVTGVTLSQTELSLLKGTSAELTASVSPADATNKNVTWRSDNAGIVTVENGVVTAVAEGQTTVRVFTEDGNFTTECKVTVPSVAVTGVKLAQNKLTLKKDDSFTLVATVEPYNASNKVVMWSSDNTAVATVSDAGLVEAKTVGTATITVTTQDGGFTATCEVTITAEDVVLLTGLRLSPSETRLKVGGEATLSVTYEPAGATQREVTWSTSDAAIVTVDEHGKVKAIAAGEATITVASKTNASIQATCKVIVGPATAVEDAMFANVVVAPNPFDNQLRIVNSELRGTYTLLNAQGVVVRSGNMYGREVLIETSDLTSGLYLLRLTAENGAVKTITVVK